MARERLRKPRGDTQYMGADGYLVRRNYRCVIRAYRVCFVGEHDVTGLEANIYLMLPYVIIETTCFGNEITNASALPELGLHTLFL